VLETSCEASAGPAGASIPQRGSDAATRPGPGVRTSASPSAAPASVDRLQFVVEDQRRPSSSEWRSESDTFAGAKRSLSIRSAPVRSQRSARGWIVCGVVDVQRRHRAAARASYVRRQEDRDRSQRAPVRSQRSARGRWIVCRVVDVQRRRRAAARGQLRCAARHQEAEECRLSAQRARTVHRASRRSRGGGWCVAPRGGGAGRMSILGPTAAPRKLDFSSSSTRRVPGWVGAVPSPSSACGALGNAFGPGWRSRRRGVSNGAGSDSSSSKNVGPPRRL